MKGEKALFKEEKIRVSNTNWHEKLHFRCSLVVWAKIFTSYAHLWTAKASAWKISHYVEFCRNQMVTSPEKKVYDTKLMFIKATLWRFQDYYSRFGAVYRNKEGNKKFLLWYQFCACSQETWDAITPVIRMNRSWISGLSLFGQSWWHIFLFLK